MTSTSTAEMVFEKHKNNLDMELNLAMMHHQFDMEENERRYTNYKLSQTERYHSELKKIQSTHFNHWINMGIDQRHKRFMVKLFRREYVTKIPIWVPYLPRKKYTSSRHHPYATRSKSFKPGIQK